ncbi:MAG: hypothetical protein IJ115_07460 [Erysipelotrichaceae bacterium]|nr:hypothetical protein [Erysipelotrichaceae bacterium]
MKKIKDFFDKLLYDEPDEPEKEGQEEEVVVAPVRKPQPKPVEKPVVKKEEVKKEPEVVEVIKEERKTPSFITLPKTETEEEPVIEEEAAKPAEKPVVKQPQVVEEPVKPMSEEERRKELDYHTSTVISPMFGVQEKKEEKGRGRHKKPEPEKIPDLADIQSSNKSVLGTVFSPLYGDKDASDSIPHDDISDDIAKLSIEDFIETKKEEKPVAKAEPKVEKPVEPKVEKKVEIPVIVPQTKKVTEEAKQEEKKPEFSFERPDLIVSPFGIKENKREKLNDDQYYENMSLFDLEDKQ